MEIGSLRDDWAELPHLMKGGSGAGKPREVFADYTVPVWWDISEMEMEYNFDWFDVVKYYVRYSDLYLELKCGRRIDEIPAESYGYCNWQDPYQCHKEPVSVEFR
jgi:hypothetical protein